MSAELRDLGSRQVWVVDEGEGPAIVFVHGLGGTANVFDPAASALVGDHRVICFDLTGHGMSPLAKETSIAGWADDVVAILDDCGVEQASIVAHSMGTIVAQQVIASHPHRVDKVVLLGPIRDLAPAGRQTQRERAALVRESGMAAVAHTISRAATSPTVQADQPAVVAFVKELLAAAITRGLRRSVRGARRVEPAGRLGVRASGVAHHRLRRRRQPTRPARRRRRRVHVGANRCHRRDRTLDTS